MIFEKCFLRASGLVVFLVAAIGSANACTTCAKSLELTKKQITCLELFLPSYLAEATDPVIVSLISCSNKSAMGASTDAHSDPVLKPIVDPKGDDKAAEKVYFLTKKQIICLRSNMGLLKKAKGPQVTFNFSDCKS